jgi:hypothetical protein
MSGDRYEIEDACPGVVGVKLGANTWYLDDEQPEAGAIRQQARDLAAAIEERELFRSMVAEQREHLDRLRAELAAAVAERDRLIAELPLSTGRDVNETRERLGPITRIADGPSERAYVCATTAREVVGYVIAERDSAKLRAERAEARLAAIDNAPTVGWIADSGELIARPEAK